MDQVGQDQVDAIANAQSQERMPCPCCAEMIMKAAKKCCHCGEATVERIPYHTFQLPKELEIFSAGPKCEGEFDKNESLFAIFRAIQHVSPNQVVRRFFKSLLRNDDRKFMVDSGSVKDFRYHQESVVTGEGGGTAMYQASHVTTSVKNYTDLWFESEVGDSIKVDLPINFGVQKGHLVTLVWMNDGVGDRIACAHNHNTDETYHASEKRLMGSKPRFKLLQKALFSVLAFAALVGVIDGAESMSKNFWPMVSMGLLVVTPMVVLSGKFIKPIMRRCFGKLDVKKRCHAILEHVESASGE